MMLVKFKRLGPAPLFMIISGLSFAVVHAAVKLIPRIPAHEIIVVRAAISASLTLVALRRSRLSPWGQNRLLLTFRGAVGTAALLLYFYTIQKMPLASAVTIQYLHPILTVILASFFLREPARPKQWLYFALSFLGVMLVKGIDPRVELLDLGLGIASAGCSAIAYNLIRALGKEDNALVIVFYLPFVSFLVLGPWTAFHFIAPTGYEWGVLIALGLFTQVAQYYMTKAYQVDTAANISNLNYLGILYASLIGLIYFNESIAPLALAGIALIVVSAILSVRR